MQGDSTAAAGRPRRAAARRRAAVGAGAGAVAIVAVALAGCSSSPKNPVVTAVVGRGTVSEVVEAPANVTARATATLSAPATGTVSRLSVRDGQRVAAGTVVARIASPQAVSALKQAKQADAAAASSSVSVPSADLSGQQQQADLAAAKGFTAAVAAAKAIPDATARGQALAAVRSAQAQYAAASAQARSAVARFNAGLDSLSTALSSLGQAQRVQTRAAVTAAQRVVDSLVLRTPIAGVVQLGSGGAAAGSSSSLSSLASSLPSSVAGQAGSLLGVGGSGSSAVSGQVATGSPVSAGQTLLTVTDVSTLSLAAEVDETDVLQVHPGVRADVELDAVPGARYTATVTSVDLSPTTSARGGVTYVVRLALGAGHAPDGSPAPVPRPGMSAVADLHVRTAVDAVALPSSATFRDGPSDAVWLVVAGRATERKVTLGAQGDATVQVLRGVDLGQRVVVRGVDTVHEGQKLP